MKLRERGRYFLYLKPRSTTQMNAFHTLFGKSVVGMKRARFFVSPNLCLSLFVSLWRLQLVYVLLTFIFCLTQNSVCFHYKNQQFNIVYSNRLVVSNSRVQQKKRNYCQSAKEDSEYCRNSWVTSITDDVPQQYVLFCLQTNFVMSANSLCCPRKTE